MTKYEKAATYFIEEGISAKYTSDGVSVLFSHFSKYYWVTISEHDVNYYAKKYDESLAQELKETDPREVLEEVARIFHNLGWNLGNNGGQDTSYIESSEKYLETVYKAFNPYNKK